MLGEANFSDHGANRLGASALMQGLADGYFVIPYTLGALPRRARTLPTVTTDHDAFKEARSRGRRSASTQLLAVKGTRTSAQLHRELGRILWDDVGMARNEAGLQRALDADSAAARGVLAERLGAGRRTNNLNQSLEYAGRVADYLEFAELLALDALHRTRVVRRPLPRGEPDARRRGAARRRRTSRTSRPGSSRASAREPALHKEPLVFEEVHPTQRSYK